MFLGCSRTVTEDFMTTSKPDTGYCPEGHSDEIIPIVYGLPTDEMFAKSDSGLVYLAGCEMEEEQWYCKKHDKTF